MSQLLNILDKACVLLGSSLSRGGDSYSKAQSLCQTFIDGAVEEVYLAIPWSFALVSFSDTYTSDSPEEFVRHRGIQLKFYKINPDTKKREIDYKLDYTILKVLSIAPSNVEWYLQGDHEFYFKGEQIDYLAFWSLEKLNIILSVLKGYKQEKDADQRYINFAHVPTLDLLRKQ